ncbi:hypothetical protein HELRODRAFT_171777 [Helobdella robusta]|uniref:Uncharacterized protein n=1 Tax=Helobdella robusta TaxID=6412 RepID=T1F4N5_HELRO|nr:hypothetical protein HELRODRAFT_171777 [Helobdella robusta]ESO05386.1 hypothetical protein HELRODRAFT_171777 [Helobdella robusta]
MPSELVNNDTTASDTLNIRLKKSTRWTGQDIRLENTTGQDGSSSVDLLLLHLKSSLQKLRFSTYFKTNIIAMLVINIVFITTLTRALNVESTKSLPYPKLLRLLVEFKKSSNYSDFTNSYKNCCQELPMNCGNVFRNSGKSGFKTNYFG